jgi:hypothetical protein
MVPAEPPEAARSIQPILLTAGNLPIDPTDETDPSAAVLNADETPPYNWHWGINE